MEVRAYVRTREEPGTDRERDPAAQSVVQIRAAQAVEEPCGEPIQVRRVSTSLTLLPPPRPRRLGEAAAGLDAAGASSSVRAVGPSSPPPRTGFGATPWRAVRNRGSSCPSTPPMPGATRTAYEPEPPFSLTTTTP